MKKNNFFNFNILFFVLFTSSCFSQENNNIPTPSNKTTETFRIKVNDNFDKPIEYVSIVYLKHNVGTYSDSKGEAILPLILDSLKISCIGFKDTVVMIKISLKKEIFIKLQNQIQQLQVVNIFANHAFKNEKELGLDEKSNNYFKPGYGSQIAFRINNINLSALKSVKLNHLKTQYSSNIKIEIRPDENGYPSNNSVIKDTIVSTKKGTRFTEVVFLNENIKLENKNFFIVVTHLGLKNFLTGDYIKYKGQPIEPFFLLTDQEKYEKTYLNYLNRKWRLYPKLMNQNNGKEISNVIFSCKVISN